MPALVVGHVLLGEAREGHQGGHQRVELIERQRELARALTGQSGEPPFDIADDAPGVGREPVAHRISSVAQSLQGLGQTAEPLGAGDQREQLGGGVA